MRHAWCGCYVTDMLTKLVSKAEGDMHLGLARHVLVYNIEVHIIEVCEEGVNWI